MDNVQRFTVENQVHLYSQFAKVQKNSFIFSFFNRIFIILYLFSVQIFISIMDKSNKTDYLEENQNFVKDFKTKYDFF